MLKIETGIDMVEINRLTILNSAIRTRFLERVYTPRELVDCDDRAERLAGRFAVKEAAAKALGTGIGDIHWQDLEVCLNKSGKPFLLLHGEAEKVARQNGWVSWSVSISHTRTTAAAIVTALLDNSD